MQYFTAGILGVGTDFQQQQLMQQSYFFKIYEVPGTKIHFSKENEKRQR